MVADEVARCPWMRAHPEVCLARGFGTSRTPIPSPKPPFGKLTTSRVDPVRRTRKWCRQDEPAEWTLGSTRWIPWTTPAASGRRKASPAPGPASWRCRPKSSAAWMSLGSRRSCRPAVGVLPTELLNATYRDYPRPLRGRRSGRSGPVTSYSAAFWPARGADSRGDTPAMSPQNRTSPIGATFHEPLR